MTSHVSKSLDIIMYSVFFNESIYVANCRVFEAFFFKFWNEKDVKANKIVTCLDNQILNTHSETRDSYY